MSEEKYYCARCGADMTSRKFNCYASDIDHKLICFECFQKEQPKYLIQQIADLEAKLAEKERDFDLLMLSKNEEINEWITVRDDKNKVIDRQTDKINELKQQLAEKDLKITELQTKLNLKGKVTNE